MIIQVTNTERINEYIHKFDDKLNTVTQLGFIETPKGIIATENDSVHSFLEDDEKLRFNLTEKINEKSFTFSNTTAGFTFLQLKENNLLDLVELKDFIDSTFGQRKKSNYLGLLDTIEKANKE